jgi:anti-sigma-K factor RskA
MSDSSRRDRLLELLADRALVGLGEAEEAEVALLLREFPNEDPDAFDRAAAAAMLASLGKLEPLPQHLAAKIEAQTPVKNSVIATSAIPMRSAPPASVAAPDRFRFMGWLAAAACLLVAIYSWHGRSSAVVTTKPTLAELRAQLVADPQAVAIAWSATKDPGAAGASGDVVFSVAKQTGFMRFHGLAANDPKQRQYQLWIFDKAQDEKYPIDGGVFDVTQDPANPSGDVIVQIQPKIRVTDPTLFAVTIENPGGVVVSKREHIVVTAAKS